MVSLIFSVYESEDKGFARQCCRNMSDMKLPGDGPHVKACQRCQRLFQPLTSLTCFDIHKI